MAIFGHNLDFKLSPVVRLFYGLVHKILGTLIEAHALLWFQNMPKNILL